MLWLETREIYRAPIDSRGSSCLQPTPIETDLTNAIGEGNRGRFAISASREALLADVNEAI